MKNYFVKHKILETEVGPLSGPQRGFQRGTANGTDNGAANGTANFIIKTINNLVLGP